jgi:hypothetical protein
MTNKIWICGNYSESCTIIYAISWVINGLYHEDYNRVRVEPGGLGGYWGVVASAVTEA